MTTSACWKGKWVTPGTEPVMLCLMSAIETGVIFLINDGIDRGLWDLQNKAERQNDILVKYRHMSVPPES
ncbi:hypothetical protein ACLB1Q_09265 [Escherichia coli]